MLAVLEWLNKPFKAQLAQNGELQVVATTYVFTKKRKRKKKEKEQRKARHCYEGVALLLLLGSLAPSCLM